MSVHEGAISSTTLLKRLRSGLRKSATYAAFREVGRVIRTVQLLPYLSDASLRRQVTAATNKVEAFNGFSQWLGFGNRCVLADDDPVEQEKVMSTDPHVRPRRARERPAPPGRARHSRRGPRAKRRERPGHRAPAARPLHPVALDVLARAVEVADHSPGRRERAV
ncbi:Tn3 family transposase [Streptomyces sp. NPDC093801]|uniref:Tn3 family transposase n=1 Tax=Streptomyces sp. NPDC093801 TaxID=3155203 RepID=UPI00344F4195